MPSNYRPVLVGEVLPPEAPLQLPRKPFDVARFAFNVFQLGIGLFALSQVAIMVVAFGSFAVAIIQKVLS